MTERPPQTAARAPSRAEQAPPGQAPPGQGPPGQAVPDEAARRAQFLATEHWSLLATRSLSWNEAFSRTSMFLSVLSAATVALALAGPAMAFGSAFVLFALVVLSVALFLGVATFVRLVQVNNEDLYWVFGMNKLRAAYRRMVPGIEADFIAGSSLDARGVARSFGVSDVTSGPGLLHSLVTTPAVVAVVTSAIAGVIAGLVAIQVQSSLVLATVVGLVAFALGVVLGISYGARETRRFIARMSRDQQVNLSVPPPEA